jgi:hypothetical protein
MSDRLDETLRAMAQAHAPADLSARVRVALEAGPRTPPLWPTLAAAAVVVLVAVGGWLTLDERGAEAPPPHAQETVRGGGASAPRVSVRGGGASAPRVSVRGGGASAPRVSVPGAASAPRVRPQPEKRTATAPPPQSTVQVATRVPPADHEHALPSLGALAAVGPTALATEPMVVVPQQLAPLTPIAAIEIPALYADEGERR